ncbi:NLR family CARD domain-containing protein 3-like [Coregonus clupeaformis]|uniref:NLR family CARD domain-containing protein 3-like n=1 Tax=Coregonus clupeaformis TaxID=59861 RepID=UPI001BE04ABB|nr:NLR family CARD domain-containing protein 3-like [Coregonus clupeaformis]XP_041751033.1 NLR family CARD domain-containing protein 3-like [Coregonus clupeaformis]
MAGRGSDTMEDDGGETISDVSFPLGEGVSGRGRSSISMSDEGEEAFYVPESRPTLDLGDGPRPMDTTYWHDVERARSPVHSYNSVYSDTQFCQSDELDEETELSATRVQLERTESYSSCYSVDSDDCENRTRKSQSAAPKAESPEVELPLRPELIKNPGEKRHPAMTVDFTFKAIRKTLERLGQDDLRKFKITLWKRYPESFSAPPQGMDMVDLVDRLLECYDLEVALQLTKALLKDMDLKRLADYLTDLCKKNEVRYELRHTLLRKYSSMYEGFAQQGEHKAFDSVFNELYITDRGNAGPNIQHEVRKIDKLSTNRKKEELITCRQIFDPNVIYEKHVSHIVTNGIAGVGKSVAVQKFIMDWAEEREHSHVYFLFPLPFKELNLMLGLKTSLLEIVHTLYPETKVLPTFECDEGKVMFICDGLDEYARRLDFHRTETLCDSTEPATMHVVVTNLIRGNLLPSSLLWIISRPLTSSRLPPEAVHQVLEVRGFTDEQKEEYFRRRFQDPAQANKVIAHLTSCKTLHIMCHLPMFCWVVCGVFQRTFSEKGPDAELPKGLTLMYTHLLLVHLHVRGSRGSASRTPEEERDFLMKLGKLAFTMLEKNQMVIGKDALKDCGVDVAEAVTKSGLCIEFLIEQFVMYQERIQTFIHPTIQEYLAALYVFLTWRCTGQNVLQQPLKSKFSRMFKDPGLLDMHRSAIERSLQSPDGNLDVFLRFLLGMAQTANQELLQRFLPNMNKYSSVSEETAAIIRKKIKENHHPDRNANLQCCLDELGVGAEARSRSRSNSVKNH